MLDAMIASDSANLQPTRAEKKKALDAAYYQAHKEKIKLRAREYAARNVQANRDRARKWYYSHRDYALDRTMIRHRANRDSILEYKAEYRKKNRDRLRAKQKQYALEHPEQHLNASAIRRARKRNNTVNSVGIRKWMGDVKSNKTFICYYCQQRISTKRVHFDHIVPLSRGGMHSLSNLCASCDECNMSKKTKLILELRINGQQLMNL